MQTVLWKIVITIQKKNFFNRFLNLLLIFLLKKYNIFFIEKHLNVETKISKKGRLLLIYSNFSEKLELQNANIIE